MSEAPFRAIPDPRGPYLWAVVNEPRKELIARELPFDVAHELADALNAGSTPEATVCPST